MKKFICIVFAVLMAFSAVGCAATDPVVNLDAVKPWESSTNYESATYKIEKWAMKKSGNSTVRDFVIASGEYKYEIKDKFRTLDNGTPETADDIQLSEFSYSYTLNYIDDEKAGKDRNLTDTLVVKCEYQTIGCTPVTSYQKNTYAPRPDEKQNLSYEISADFHAGVSKINFMDKVDSEVKLGKGTYFDNSQFYFILRAFEGLSKNSSVSFMMTNLFEIHKENSFFKRKMSVSTSDKLTSVTLGSWIKDFGFELNDDGNCDLDCYSSQMSIASTQSGPPTVFYISETPFEKDGIKTKKVIVKITDKEYDIPSATEKYNWDYTITNYTTAKPIV